MSTFLTFSEATDAEVPSIPVSDSTTSMAYSPDRTSNSPTTGPNQSPTEGRKTSVPAPHGLNARSCVTCRKRKVRCDKQVPCSNCSKAGSQCVFPAPGRAPRRPRIGAKPVSDREAELLKRLRRLEGVVEELSGQVEAGDTKQSPSSADSSREGEMDTGDKPKTVRVIGMDEGRSKKDWMGRAFNLGSGPPKSSFNLEKNFGRLMVDEGKSEYINSPFWTRINEEVAEIKDILDDAYDSESESLPILPNGLVTEPNHQSFIMGYSSADVDLKGLHPLPSQIPFYWQTFLENVNPLVKVIHIGTMNKVIKDVQNNLDFLSKSTEALMFAIYFATITSMSPEEVKVNFGTDKEVLSRQYRFGVEQALARAGFLNTNEIVTVQAFVLFLVCVRRHDDTRFVWSLTGLVIRIAQAIGLHRDGSEFGLSPFDAEMRRRIWWQVCVLDLRASEDHGSEPMIVDATFDTRIPLSINDDDLTPDATELPQPRKGVSEMTFCLIRYEICTIGRRLNYVPPGLSPCQKARPALTLEEKERLLKESSAYIEDTYLKYCEDAGPLYWVAATVARLIISKMNLIIYHPLTQPGKANSLSQDIKDRLFMSSIEIIEYSRVLESEASTRQWGWLFKTYVQWHAIAYILGELCVRSKSAMVDRAWRAVDGIFFNWNMVLSHSKREGMLWQPMRKLMAKARKKREEDMQLTEGDSSQLGIDTRFIRPEPSGLLNNPSGCPGTMARDRALDNAQTAASTSQSPFQTANATMQSYQGDQFMFEPQIVGMGALAPDQIQLQLQQQQFANEGTPWLMDDSALPELDMNTIEGGVNWESWDDLVRDFQMEADQQMTDRRGPNIGSMGQWW